MSCLHFISDSLSQNTGRVYAPEIWGLGSSSRAKLLKSVQENISKLVQAEICTGGRLPQAEAANRELGLQPIADIVLVQALRLFHKCLSARTTQRDENFLGELLLTPEPPMKVKKLSGESPLYSLKADCAGIVRAARGISFIHSKGQFIR